MPAENETAVVLSRARWTGWVLSSLVILFLIFDLVVKLIPARHRSDEHSRAWISRQRVIYPRTRHAFARLHGALRVS